MYSKNRNKDAKKRSCMCESIFVCLIEMKYSPFDLVLRKYGEKAIYVVYPNFSTSTSVGGHPKIQLQNICRLLHI